MSFVKLTTIMACGGRDFGCFIRDGRLVVVKPERDFIHDTLTAVAGFNEDGEPLPVRLIHGDCATGADRVSKAWAEKNMMPQKSFPADWDRYGKAAGPRRNQEMADYHPDICIAFPGGAGTKDAVRRCTEAGIFVVFPQWK